ncbi:MAG: hypothetical protein ACOYJS_05290 [Acutalibacteraceae bacterium]|jgi:hypothetical protein
MPNKKTSETLKQQRIARQKFLELKKMQQGLIDPGPKPSEVAIVPKTISEKTENWWFHYKWYFLGTLFVLSGLIFLISQCAARINYDMQVVYFTYTPVMDQQTELIADYLESISDDINGDGQTNIQVVNCSIKNDVSDLRYRSTAFAKLQSLMAGEPKAMLFITDKESIKYFDADAAKGFLEEKPVVLGNKFYEATKSDEFGTLPEDLQISCRQVDGTLIEKQKNVSKIYTEAQKILEKLKE